MTVVCESIDDRDAGIPGHLFNHFMAEGANHDALHHAVEIFCHVIYRLALAEIDLRRRKIERKTTQLLDAHIKTYSCS